MILHTSHHGDSIAIPHIDWLIKLSIQTKNQIRLQVPFMNSQLRQAMLHVHTFIMALHFRHEP